MTVLEKKMVFINSKNMDSLRILRAVYISAFLKI